MFSAAHVPRNNGGMKNAVLSQRVGHISAGCRSSVCADCALPILPSSEPGCKGEKTLYRNTDLYLALVSNLCRQMLSTARRIDDAHLECK